MKHKSVLAMLLLLSLVGCGDDQPETPAAPKIFYGTQPATFTFESSGAHDVKVTANDDLRLLSLDNPDLGESFTVGTNKPLQAADGWVVEVYVTAAGEAGDGDGSFVVTPGEASGAPSQNQPMRNTVYANVYRGTAGAATEGGRYDEPGAPCQGSLSKEGGVGTVTCTNIADRNSKKVISFTMSWEATGPRKEEPVKPPTSSTTATPSG